MEGSSSTKEKHRMTYLSNDLLIGILSRVPYKSLCRFRCVSRSWHAICSDREIVNKSPQTVSGFFFYKSDNIGGELLHLRLLNLSGSGRPLLDPPLPFLLHYGCIRLVHSCNGLLLCRCWRRPRRISEFCYVVCNPATKQWTVLPRNPVAFRGSTQAYRLGFDPAISSHFSVFMFVLGSQFCGSPIRGVMIFSSETGDWTYKESKLLGDTRSVSITDDSHGVFFNGILHMTSVPASSLITVDTEGETWRRIPMPCMMDHRCTSIWHSQGRLYVMHVDLSNACQLSIWVLQDYNSEQWTLKNTLRILELFGRSRRSSDEFYDVIALHPERNLVFIIWRAFERQGLMSYNMDNRGVQFICSLDGDSLFPRAPYVPYLGEFQLSDGQK